MEVFVLRQTHRQTELDGVDGLVEGPGELMLPQGLHHHVLHVLQLVGLSERHKRMKALSQSCRRTHCVTVYVLFLCSSDHILFELSWLVQEIMVLLMKGGRIHHRRQGHILFSNIN